jgi:pimeloyl-ACP methyl ester carboxylesterase
LISRVEGIVLDSSPALVVPDVASRAMVSAVFGEPAEGIEQRHPWLVKATAAVVDLYLRWEHIDETIRDVHATWQELVPPCPKLFLYSDSDVLVDTGVIECFMLEQAARGSLVLSKRWHDSAHVDHWRAHPEEYEQELRDFVARLEPQETDRVIREGSEVKH